MIMIRRGMQEGKIEKIMKSSRGKTVKREHTSTLHLL